MNYPELLSSLPTGSMLPRIPSISFKSETPQTVELVFAAFSTPDAPTLIDKNVKELTRVDEEKGSFAQIICRIIWIAGSVGLLAGLLFASPWAIGLGAAGVISGGIGDFIVGTRKAPKNLGGGKVIGFDISESEIFSPIASQELPPLPLGHKASIAMQNQVAAWAKLGNKITPPGIMENARARFREWLAERGEQDFLDLFKTMPDKTTNLVENFPDVFAVVCTPREIALIASCMRRYMTDPEGKAITNVLQAIYNTAVIPENLSKEGRLKNREAIARFYSILKEFAEVVVFHPAVENQLKAFKMKIPPSSIPPNQMTPAKLCEKIHDNIEDVQKIMARKAQEGLERPDVTDKRKQEIGAFANALVQQPDADHFKRRKVLTEMAKHPKRVEIPFLIEFLGTVNLKYLWQFEAVVDNRANDPTVRLTEMLAALSYEQFSLSLSLDSFRKVIKRCPPAIYGLRVDCIREIAEAGQNDEALYNLYKLLLEDKSIKHGKKAEVIAALETVRVRVEAKAARELAGQLRQAPIIDVAEFADSLRATMDPEEIGKVIDRMDEMQLTDFLSRLGEHAKLNIFWTIAAKKILAHTETLKQKRRLERIFPKLSDVQIALLAQMDVFCYVIGNSEDGYINAAASNLTSHQFAIIARSPKAAWGVKDIINKFVPGDKAIFPKLLAIAQNVPSLREVDPGLVKLDQYRETLVLMRDAAGKCYITMPEPDAGWGGLGNKKEAAKHLTQLFNSKLI